MGLFNWFKKLCMLEIPIPPLIPKVPTVKSMYEEIDEECKRKDEVWHYECINGHKWKSHSSPTSTFCRDSYGMKETICPECGSTICRGDVYRDGKKTCMGAMHVGFRK